MEKMNGNELRSVLIEQNLIDEAGTVNAFKVYCISGAFLYRITTLLYNKTSSVYKLSLDYVRVFAKTSLH